jgi:hypothetical protein
MRIISKAGRRTGVALLAFGGIFLAPAPSALAQYYYPPPPPPPPPPGYYSAPPPGYYAAPPPDYDDDYYDRPHRTWNGCPPNWTIQGGVCKPYQGPVGGGYRTYNGCAPGWTIQGGVCRPYRGY